MKYQISYNGDRNKFFVEKYSELLPSYNRIILSKLKIGFSEYQKTMEENFNAVTISRTSTSFSTMTVVFNNLTDAARALDWIESIVLAQKLV